MVWDKALALDNVWNEEVSLLVALDDVTWDAIAITWEEADMIWDSNTWADEDGVSGPWGKATEVTGSWD